VTPSPPDALSPQFIYRVARKRAPRFAIIFAILFSAIAFSQYLFVQQGVYGSARRQMEQDAQEVSTEIGYKDHWNLTPFRSSEDVKSPHVFVFTTDGILIETTGYIPGSVGRAALLDPMIFDQPKTVTVSETGETWREFAVRVKGGIVALGVWNPRDVNNPDD